MSTKTMALRQGKRLLHQEGTKAAASVPQWQTWKDVKNSRRGSAMNREITERQYRIGTVPMRWCDNVRLRHQPHPDKELPFTGFELLFLGTSAGAPSVRRNPTGLCFRNDRSTWMFDCAEASLRQLMRSTIRVPSTDKFFITHLHGDHVYGLPGILCTLDNHNAAYYDPRLRKRVPRPISVYGPLGLFTFLNTALMTSSTRLSNLVVTVHELVSPDILANASAFERYNDQAPRHPSLKREMIYADSDGNNPVWNVFDDGNHKVMAATLEHTVMSFGYVVEEHELPGKLLPQLVIKKGLRPGPLYRELKQGKSVTLPNGEVINPSDVTGPPTRGRKAVILGDTADSARIYDIGKNCDVLVHEATLSHEMLIQAVVRGHSTARMAGYTARRLNATLLALTHFSHRFRHWTAGQDFAGFGTTQQLANDAQITFGRRAVVAAADFRRIPVPRRQNEEN